ncbi:MAG: aryl-sulfate sulfotransferase [Flavobacteriales bacterium]|nr:aryl-sulfate sulfotransferase [Flavobacteriales bacterium]
MKTITSFFFLIIIIGEIHFVKSQTVGTLLNSADSYNGYTLFAPMGSKFTYLINNCGEQIQSWESTVKPGLSAYLLEDGSLLRAANRSNSTFTSGGSGGGVQLFDWDGNLQWDYQVSSSSECQHHDIEYLPNGNVLLIVWESKSNAEAIQSGRNPNSVPSTFWPDKIIEVEPSGMNGGTIVWEWHAWDHAIQEFDNSKDNYGVVADHPELININYPSTSSSDWLHINSVDYNPALDQIVLSSHNTNELWVIDHSTTTSEAASHTGGTYGKGGDLLYRWGNPLAYGRGTQADKKFFGQHDAHWITEGSDAGKLMIYNNGANRIPGVSYSSVDVIAPPVDANGNYAEPSSGESFLPSAQDWIYGSSSNTDFFSSNISGAHRLPNENTLICEGSSGHFFEINPNGNVVWEYQNPVANTGPVSQGTVISNATVFRCTRYGADYSAFAGKDMTPGAVIELNSNISCDLYGTNTDVAAQEQTQFQVIPNPASDIISITNLKPGSYLTVFDSYGRLILQRADLNNLESINVSYWPSGVYHLSVQTGNSQSVTKLIVN